MSFPYDIPNYKNFEYINFVKIITIGSVNPNNPLSPQSKQAQADLLNKCLNECPKGIIIGKDITIGRYAIGEHELVMQQTTYHIGFQRKPIWLQD